MAGDTAWEYHAQSFGHALRGPKDEELVATLNEWGEQGWEVFAALHRENSNRILVLAKRPLSAEVRRRRSAPGPGW